jgi:hypothetical protein
MIRLPKEKKFSMIRFDDEENSFYSENEKYSYGNWINISQNLMQISSGDVKLKQLPFFNKFPFVISLFDFVPTFDMSYLDPLLNYLSKGRKISKFESIPYAGF